MESVLARYPSYCTRHSFTSLGQSRWESSKSIANLLAHSWNANDRNAVAAAVASTTATTSSSRSPDAREPPSSPKRNNAAGAGVDDEVAVTHQDAKCQVVLSTNYLLASHGGPPAYYSLCLSVKCSSIVVVHLGIVVDSICSIRLSCDRLVFAPEDFDVPQFVRVEVLENCYQSNVIVHRVFSLDQEYDRLGVPNVVVKSKWSHASKLLFFGGNKKYATTSAKSRAKAKMSMATLAATATAASAIAGDTKTRRDTSTGASPPASPSSESPPKLDPIANALPRLRPRPTLRRSSTFVSPFETQGTVELSTTISRVASGNNFTVVASASGTIYTWGTNSSGELGNGTILTVAEPTSISTSAWFPLGSTLVVTAISCGKQHAALVTNGGVLYTWGNNKYGQLGHGEYTPYQTVPREVRFDKDNSGMCLRSPRYERAAHCRDDLAVTQIACGAHHTLIGTSHLLVMGVGYNQAGQLGIGHCLQQYNGWRSCTPVAIPGLVGKNVLELAAGQNHSAALLSNGQVYTWGSNDDGRLGLGNVESQLQPRLVASLSELKIKCRMVRCGGRHTAVVSDTDLVFMWGANEFGQLGCGDTLNRSFPQALNCAVLLAEGVTSVSLGEFHSSCITLKGQALTWGLDLNLATREKSQRNRPVALVLPEQDKAVQVCCGWNETHLVAFEYNQSNSHWRGYNKFTKSSEALKRQSRRQEFRRWAAFKRAYKSISRMHRIILDHPRANHHTTGDHLGTNDPPATIQEEQGAVDGAKAAGTLRHVKPPSGVRSSPRRDKSPTNRTFRTVRLTSFLEVVDEVFRLRDQGMTMEEIIALQKQPEEQKRHAIQKRKQQIRELATRFVQKAVAKAVGKSTKKLLALLPNADARDSATGGSKPQLKGIFYQNQLVPPSLPRVATTAPATTTAAAHPVVNSKPTENGVRCADFVVATPPVREMAPTRPSSGSSVPLLTSPRVDQLHRKIYSLQPSTTRKETDSTRNHPLAVIPTRGDAAASLRHGGVLDSLLFRPSFSVLDQALSTPARATQTKKILTR